MNPQESRKPSVAQAAQFGYASAISSKALFVSTKVESEAPADSDFVGLPLVKANELLALALPPHLQRQEKGLPVHRISPRRDLSQEYG